MVFMKTWNPVQKWPVVIIILIIFISLGSAKAQFPLAIPGMQMVPFQSRPIAVRAMQMVPVPPRQVAVPIGIPMPVGIAVRVPDTTECPTTTTTSATKTTSKSEDKPTKIRIIVPWPPNTFPGAPPFPMPLPLPLPGPPPLIMIPLPPIPISSRERVSSISSGKDWSSESDSTWGSSDSSSSSSSRSSWGKKKWKNKRYGINRRHGKDKTKPILTYVNKKGHVKLRKRLSKKDADTLLHAENKLEKKVQVRAGDDRSGPRVLVQSKSVKSPTIERRAPKLLKSGSQRVGLGDKDLIFRPPEGRKISNLTVSFRITR